MFESITQSVMSNARALRLAFLFGTLTYVAYFAAWISWKAYIPRVPLYLLFVFAYPWSMAWHNWHHNLVGGLAWPIRDTISIAVAAVGFGLNCALVLAIIKFFRPPTHNLTVHRTLHDKTAQRR